MVFTDDKQNGQRATKKEKKQKALIMRETFMFITICVDTIKSRNLRMAQTPFEFEDI